MGKIIIFVILIFIFASLTNVNFSPVYEKFASTRDSALPYIDKFAEKSLQISSNAHIQEKLQPLINQLQKGNGTT